MASIQRRRGLDGKITFRVQIRLKGAPKETGTFSTKTAAKAWAQSTEAAIRENRHFRTAEARRRTVTDLIDRYIEHWLPQKPSSFVTQRFQLLWWRGEIGDRVLADLRPDVFIDARIKLGKRVVAKKNSDGTISKAKLSSSTINRYFAALSPVFTMAVRELGWLHDNPLNGLTRLKEPTGRVRFLSPEELKLLYVACKNSPNKYLRPFVLLALSTGMRKNEILRLRWKDFEADMQQVTLQDTKNGEKRSLPLPAKVREHVLRMRAAAEKKLEPGASISSLHLFPGRSPDQPLDIRVPWEKAIRFAKIQDFKIHDLRHTAASYLAMNGASLLDIAHILGHKSLDMVKRYAHLSPQHTSAVLEKLSTRLEMIGR